MTLHLFQDRDTDVFAFTSDRTGLNLPTEHDTEWLFLETLDEIEFAWGEQNFGDVYSAVAVTGFYLFQGEMQPLRRDKRRRRTRSRESRTRLRS